MRRASLLSRLALALLAVMGFVAPLVEVEPDRVVQTVTGPRGETVQQHVAPTVLAALPSPEPLISDPAIRRSPPQETRHRYLLHRAWLI